MGKAMYRELTGLKKPVLDKDNILHWPVLLLYAEVMSSDFIEDFCETDMFSAHLDLISLSFTCFFTWHYVNSICHRVSKSIFMISCMFEITALYFHFSFGFPNFLHLFFWSAGSLLVMGPQRDFSHGINELGFLHWLLIMKIFFKTHKILTRICCAMEKRLCWIQSCYCCGDLTLR